MSGTERTAGRPLSVDADLALELGGAGARARVAGRGDVIVVDVPSLRAARALAEGARAVPAGTGTGAFGLLGAGLDRADVRVDVRVRGASVARAGPGIDPGPASRLLGSLTRTLGPPWRVSLGGAALAALRRR